MLCLREKDYLHLLSSTSPEEWTVSCAGCDCLNSIKLSWLRIPGEALQAFTVKSHV